MLYLPRMHQEDHLASTFTIQQTHKLLIKECRRLHSKYGYTPVNIARIIIPIQQMIQQQQMTNDKATR